MADPASVIVDTSDLDAVDITDSQISVPLADGSVVVDLRPPQKDDKADFDANLADDMELDDLQTLANSLLDGIEADIQSRSEWESTRTRGLELLGLKIEEPRGDLGGSSAPLEGMSTVRHPLLCEAVIRGSSNAIGELLPAEGPVKVKNVGQETGQSDELAEELEKDMNHYLTDVATEYYPDTKRMLFWTFFGGSGWKKVYSCPIRRRPVSESVDANDLIVSNSATDLWNCGRVTHKITMRPSVMKRMQLLGVYRDVALTQPTTQTNQVDDKKANIEGIKTRQDRPEDQPYTLYECYCEWDFNEFAPKQFKGEGIPLPYRVTLEKDTRVVLEIHRNWKKDDEACLPRKYFVKYPFIEAMGIYGLGLVHILGNATQALTAAWREMLDAGMFANFPGFIYLKSMGKQLTNEFRVPPGGGVGLDSPNGDIRQAAMPLPYKDITPGLLGLVDKISEASQRLGGTADLPVGEGKQDAPVGTTLALIEQATKIESTVHKGLHKAQAEEFQLLVERFREDPEALWRHNPKCKTQWTAERFEQALDNCDLIPVADPNVPSHLHRLMKATGLMQIAGNPVFSGLFDLKKVVGRALHMAKIDDVDDLWAPPSDGPPPDPAAQAKLIAAQTGQQKAETDAAKLQFQQHSEAAKNALKTQELQSKQDIATVDLSKELVIHGADKAKAEHSQGIAAGDQKIKAAKIASDHTLGQQGIALEAQKQHHETTMNLGQQATDAHKAARDAALDVSKHLGDEVHRAHERTMDVKEFNKPEPKKPKGKK